MTFDQFCRKERRIADVINTGKAEVYPGHKAYDDPILIGRAQRKREAKAKDKMITLSEKDLQKRIDDAVTAHHHEVLVSSCRMIILLVCVRLRDMYGFGAKRLRAVAEASDSLMDCVSKDYVEWEDLRDTLAEETQFFLNIGGK